MTLIEIDFLPMYAAGSPEVLVVGLLPKKVAAQLVGGADKLEELAAEGTIPSLRITTLNLN